MLLSAGDKFGHYEVLSLLGQGGMGEVYRARDTMLKREVALKVLPASVLHDPDRVARFQREAEVLASLDHIHIAPIYGLADSPDSRALVLGLVEGPTLADRIAASPIPISETIAIAKQIVEALEYAHDRGVVHRDLKPANVKITPEGVVKVLDFGLAKAAEDEPAVSRPGASPTLTMRATRAGVILGTAAYMSPEQAVGRPVDRRSDIFSFGAVLFEMLTGRQAFEGTSVPDVLEAVVKSDPDWKALPADTPAYLRRLLERTLTKDRKQRLQAIGEARIALERQVDDAVPISQAAGRAPARPQGWMAAAAVLALATALLAPVAWRHKQEDAPRPVMLNLVLEGQSAFPVISPDGRSAAFVATGGLWVRELGSAQVRKLAEARVVRGDPGVFWSPDSRSIGFLNGNKLMKVAAAGGPAQVICEIANFGGASWSRDDVIVISNREGTWRVQASGGNPTLILEPDKSRNEDRHYGPYFLPDGRHFLFSANTGERAKSAVYVGDLNSKDRKLVLTVPTNAVYANPGYLLFVQNRTLLAQAFNTAKLQVEGDAVPLADDITYNVNLAVATFSSSENGVLVYASGSKRSDSQLTWFDRSGKVLGTVGEPGELEKMSLSADGSRVVSVRADRQTGNFELWDYDLIRHTDFRLTFTGTNRFPVFSPDGTEIVFDSSRGGSRSVYRKAVVGTAQEEQLEASVKLPSDWSRDGRYVLCGTPNQTPKTGNDIWVLPLFGDRKPFPYVVTEFSEANPKLSPDGRWLAYQSSESGPQAVYVVSFPTPGGKWRISASNGAGAGYPVWSRDGRELYFFGLEGKVMAVEIAPGPAFHAGIPKPLFEARMSRGNDNIEVNREGHFLLPVLSERSDDPMWVVLNWPAMLKK